MPRRAFVFAISFALVVAFAHHGAAEYGVAQIFDGAGLYSGYCVAVDDERDIVYVTYNFTGVIVKIERPGTASPVITTFATGHSLLFQVGLDAAGHVYVVHYWGVSKYDASWNETVLLDGSPGTPTPFEFGRGLRLDAQGNVYATATTTSNGYKITPAGVVEPVLTAADGISLPTDLAFDAAGNVFIGGESSALPQPGEEHLIVVRPDGSKRTLDLAPHDLLAVGGLEVDSSERLIVAGAFGSAARVVRVTPVSSDWDAVDTIETLLDDTSLDTLYQPPGMPGNTSMGADESVYVAAGTGTGSSVWRVPQLGPPQVLLDASIQTPQFAYVLGVGSSDKGYVYAATEVVPDPVNPAAADVWRVCPDADQGGTCDLDDRCTQDPDEDPLDADADGYGNRCDGDFDQNGTVGIVDYNTLSSCLSTGVSEHDPDCDESDLNGDGAVDGDDLDLFLPLFGGAPGPSGLDCALSPPQDGSCP